MTRRAQFDAMVGSLGRSLALQVFPEFRPEYGPERPRRCADCRAIRDAYLFRRRGSARQKRCVDCQEERDIALAIRRNSDPERRAARRQVREDGWATVRADERKEKKRQHRRDGAAMLSDAYVAEKIASGWAFSASDVPASMIAAKRAQLILHREIKGQKS